MISKWWKGSRDDDGDDARGVLETGLIGCLGLHCLIIPAQRDANAAGRSWIICHPPSGSMLRRVRIDKGWYGDRKTGGRAEMCPFLGWRC
jgi:hypothetical protein